MSSMKRKRPGIALFPDGTGKSAWTVQSGAGGFLLTSSNLGNGHDTVATGYSNLTWAVDGASW